MVSIGAWVLREAACTAAKWPSDVKIAVNISPAQLQDPNFARMVQDTLAHTGLAPQHLEIEITEQMIIGGRPIGECSRRDFQLVCASRWMISARGIRRSATYANSRSTRSRSIGHSSPT